MKRPTLIDGWQHSLRLDSMRAAVLLAVLSLVQAELLPLLRADLPSRVWAYVTFGLAVLIMLVRLRAQPGALGQPEPAADTPTAPATGKGIETFKHPTER